MELEQLVASITIGQIVGWILALFGAIITIDKVITIAKNNRKTRKAPCDERLRMLDNDKRHLERVDEILDDLRKTVKEQNEADSILFNGVFALINHIISGNDVETLRDARNAMQNFLSKKGGR